MTCIFCVFNTNCQTVVLVIPLVATSGDAFLKKQANYLSLVVRLLLKCLLMPFF